MIRQRGQKEKSDHFFKKAMVTAVVYGTVVVLAEPIPYLMQMGNTKQGWMQELQARKRSKKNDKERK
jgi:hypothetical protein